MRPTLLHGDCLDVMRRLKDEGVQVDSVVTDPPYHLTSVVKRFGKPGAAPARSNGATGVYKRASTGFMGQQWDGGDIAFQPATWELAFDLLKPGGHLVAFAAPKNFHRLACAIEDAGFEIRDNILRMVAADERIELFLNSLTEEQREAFLALCVEQDAPDFLAWTFGTGFPKSHDVSKSIDKAAGAKREVIGVVDPRGSFDGRERASAAINTNWRASERRTDVRDLSKKVLSSPATETARKWDGWGTALKPAFEPVILARKPLIGTVAENVLKHGTGAINIDGCRVPAEGRPHRVGDYKTTENNVYAGRMDGSLAGGSKAEGVTDVGRFPANIIHDGSDEVLEAFPAAPGQLAAVGPQNGPKKSINVYGDYGPRADTPPRGDSGSAARFFYSAKATKADRCESKHPTVKPIALMRYLVRLVTPPGGTVLDPFAGSGTTGQAALDEGCAPMLIEREDSYFADIKRRFGEPVAEFLE